VSKEPKMGNAHVNAQADALNAVYNGGKMDFYGGTKPATADTATSEPVLVEFTLPSPCFGTSNLGVVAANTIADVVAALGGTAAWFRVWKSDGTTGLQDGTIGVTAGQFDLVIDSVTIVQGVTQHINSWQHTVPKG
jgi:hypothetical protein